MRPTRLKSTSKLSWVADAPAFTVSYSRLLAMDRARVEPRSLSRTLGISRPSHKSYATSSFVESRKILKIFLCSESYRNCAASFSRTFDKTIQRLRLFSAANSWQVKSWLYRRTEWGREVADSWLKVHIHTNCVSVTAHLTELTLSARCNMTLV